MKSEFFAMKRFRLERVGAAEDRYYVVDLASSGKMPSDWATPTPSPSGKRSCGLQLAKGQAAVSLEILGHDVRPLSAPGDGSGVRRRPDAFGLDRQCRRPGPASGVHFG